MNKNIDTRFMEEIAKCRDAEVFIGLANLLGVRLLGDAPETPDANRLQARPAEEIMIDIVDKFSTYNRTRRKELLQLLTLANLGGGDNALRTKDTKKALSNKNMRKM